MMGWTMWLSKMNVVWIIAIMNFMDNLAMIDKNDGLDSGGIRNDGKGDEVNDEHAKGLNVKQLHPYSSLFSPKFWHPPH